MALNNVPTMGTILYSDQRMSFWTKGEYVPIKEAYVRGLGSHIHPIHAGRASFAIERKFNVIAQQKRPQQLKGKRLTL